MSAGGIAPCESTIAFFPTVPQDVHLFLDLVFHSSKARCDTPSFLSSSVSLFSNPFFCLYSHYIQVLRAMIHNWVVRIPPENTPGQDAAEERWTFCSFYSPQFSYFISFCAFYLHALFLPPLKTFHLSRCGQRFAWSSEWTAFLF